MTDGGYKFWSHPWDVLEAWSMVNNKIGQSITNNFEMGIKINYQSVCYITLKFRDFWRIINNSCSKFVGFVMDICILSQVLFILQESLNSAFFVVNSPVLYCQNHPHYRRALNDSPRFIILLLLNFYIQ